MITAGTWEDARFFSHAVQYSPSKSFRSVVLRQDDAIVAMVGYDHWTPNSVQMHVYLSSPRALTRGFIYECFHYVFIQAKLGLVVGITPSNNAAALRLNKKIGFVEMYRSKDAWSPGVDMVIQEMRRENCRWV